MHPRLLPRPGARRFVLGSVSDTMRVVLLSILTFGMWLPHGAATAAGTGFDPRVIALGDSRTQIKSLPITARPNRPRHVYGNTVRRRHHRGPATGLAR